MKICKVDNCGRNAYIRGLCNAHYLRWRRHGDPLKGNNGFGPTPQDLNKRFWAKVDKSGGPDACWPFREYRDRRGYGRVACGSVKDGTARPQVASRIAYNLANPENPLGNRYCLHSCDNPPCCNPKHLRAGTQTENMKEASLKKRCRGQKCDRFGSPIKGDKK